MPINRYTPRSQGAEALDRHASEKPRVALHKNEEISLDYDNDIYLHRIIYKALGLLSWNKNLKKVNAR